MILRILRSSSPRLATVALALAAALASTPAASQEAEEHGQDAHHPAHSHRGGMVHDFSDAERWSAEFDDPERDAWQKPEEVVALMEIEPGMTVVDLGAGTGYFLERLSEAVGEEGRVLALDPETSLVEFMTRRARERSLENVEARRIPFDDPELPDGSVDRILLVNVWHHVEERPAYAGKMRAALGPGGRIYVVDYNLDSPRGPSKTHRLEPDEVVRELSRAGLEAEILEETLPYQYVVVAGKPESQGPKP